MTSIYREEAQRVGRLAFSMWNRDPGSPSYGSFDRAYWGWKYKDFSDATLQYAVRLALAYASDAGKTSTMPELLDRFATYCERIQHGDGSFDQCYPHERSPGVLYDFLSTLVFVRTSAFLTSDTARATLDRVMQRGVAFLLRTDETHGRVANHAAQYAFELLSYAAYSGDERARQRGIGYLERTLSWFDHDEGWFLEYDGADTGYQTRTLRYLTKIARLTGDEALWTVIKRAAQFVEETLGPDGSVHPMLGCRSTALLYPSAFERLAGQDSQFLPLARRVERAWSERRVPLPSELDFVNAIRLADDALDAAEGHAGSGKEVNDKVVGSTHFPRAGLVIRRSKNLAAHVSTALGGTVVIYARGRDGCWRIAHEDSGYLLESRDDDQRWLTRIPGSGQVAASEQERLVVQADFNRSLHDEMSPRRMIALRILNLTLLRFQPLADLFRRMVVRRLMSRRKSLPVRLTREIRFSDGGVTIKDSIQGRGPAGAVLYRCRRMSGVHMASARYFQEQDLDTLVLPWRAQVSADLRSGYETVTEISTS